MLHGMMPDNVGRSDNTLCCGMMREYTLYKVGGGRPDSVCRLSSFNVWSKHTHKGNENYEVAPEIK